MALSGVVSCIIDMCAYGMTSTDERGKGRVKKPTRLLTNSQCIARRLQRRCSGTHRHVHLVNGRAKACQTYPAGLCKAICEGIEEQKRVDEGNEPGLGRRRKEMDRRRIKELTARRGKRFVYIV